ncbi:MAG: hypothetical protein RMZ69_10120 [Nostoc sp. ChiQUE01a]|nr:hypothetical protein [Nostoc sp. ChiQUE01a]
MRWLWFCVVSSDAYGGKLRTLAFTKTPNYNQNSDPHGKAALIG